MISADPIDAFSSTYPIDVYTRPLDDPKIDWQEFDHGPGIFHIPAGQQVMVKIKQIDDKELRLLVRELAGFTALTYLNLSENRNITNIGMEYLRALEQVSMLNLSSCSITDAGLRHIAAMRKLEYLDLTYCNRIGDFGLKHLRDLPHLNTLQVQGCLRITKAGIARFGRRGLTILH
jgi:hypothetical protein